MKLSVIVPVLNEASRLPDFLRQITGLSVSEIIIVDGGSCDQTPAIVQAGLEDRSARKMQGEQESAAYFMIAPAGRGRQMNAGADRATGDILLFLHADSTLPQPASQWLDEISAALQNPHVVGGASRLKMDSTSPLLKWIAKAANARSMLMGLPYGDQGIFVRRPIFIEMEGYRDWPFMEDLDFVRRLKKRGKIVLLKTALTTSARRWEKGKVARSLRNIALLALYFMGVSPTRLARWYP